MHPHPYGFDGALVLPRDPIPCKPCTRYRVNAGRTDLATMDRTTVWSFTFDGLEEAVDENAKNAVTFDWSEIEVWVGVTDLRDVATGRRVALITKAVLT